MLLVRRASKVQPDLRGQQEPKEQPVIPELPGRQDRPVPQVRREPPDLLELPEQPVQLGRLDPQA